MTQIPLPNPILFEKGGPFHAMVSAFISAIVGIESVVHPANPMGFLPGQVVTLEGKVHPELRIEPFAVHKQWVLGHASPVTLSISLVSMLTNTAYEAVKERNDRSPEFEFFRHLRNACSHMNKFNFSQKEPARPAHWRGKTIDHTQKGRDNPLFGRVCFTEFVGIGDTIALLWDIEQNL